jgi:hypothetical protein
MESLNMLTGLVGMNPFVILLAVIWTLFWKGLALWRAAGLRQKYWFIAILLINTLGILEIIYLFVVTKNYKVEVIEKNE